MNPSPRCLTTRTPQLPTSRAASQQERSVLSILRALAPRRPLSRTEATLVAELQANRLLELAGLPDAPIPSELITELPRISVRQDPDLPVSGSAIWVAGRWLLSVNGSEPWTRQRFSLAHELKHVIDHRHVETLYRSSADAEAAAEYFAACLLMPKRAVHQAWAAGHQRLSTLSTMFAVSPAAIARRLEHIGLRERVPRHQAGVRSGHTGRRQYQRATESLAIGVS